MNWERTSLRSLGDSKDLARGRARLETHGRRGGWGTLTFSLSWEAHTKTIEVTTPARPPPASTERQTHRGKGEGLSEPRARYPNSKATRDTATVKERGEEEAVTRNHYHMTGMQETPSVAAKGTQKSAIGGGWEVGE